MSYLSDLLTRTAVILLTVNGKLDFRKKDFSLLVPTSHYTLYKRPSRIYQSVKSKIEFNFNNKEGKYPRVAGETQFSLPPFFPCKVTLPTLSM